MTDLKALAQDILDIKETIQAKKAVIQAAIEVLRTAHADLSEDDYNRLKSAEASLTSALMNLEDKSEDVVVIELGEKMLVCKRDDEDNTEWTMYVPRKA
jgi:hypothetical protein